MREKQAGEDRNASSGDGENDHEVRGEPTRATTEQTKIAGGDDAGADIMREEQKFLDDDDPRQGGIDRLKGNKNEDKVSDLTTTNTVASPSGKNARRKEKRKMLAMKDGTALASHSTTTVDDKKSRDSDKLKISPSPARATVAFDIESSPRSLKRSKVDDEDMQQNDAESRQKLTVERAKDVAKQASVAQLDDANQPNQGAISIDSEKAPLVERDPHRKKGYIIHASSENIARDLAMAVAEAQKDAFAVKKRVPCRGRGIPDHNPTTAYIIIPEGIKHGDKLLCSHPECRESKKFRYCKHCKAPVTDSSFRWKHRHGEESENKRDDADETRTGSDLKRGGDEVVGKGEKEQEIKVTKPRITKSTTSKDLPTDTAQAGRGPSAFTLYVEEVRPMFEKTHPNLTPAELVRKLRVHLIILRRD